LRGILGKRTKEKGWGVVQTPAPTAVGTTPLSRGSATNIGVVMWFVVVLPQYCGRREEDPAVLRGRKGVCERKYNIKKLTSI